MPYAGSDTPLSRGSYTAVMPGYECYHCKQWVGAGEAHDCATTTEAALTRDLSDDLRDAWERLRETAVEFGAQRIYASNHSIMFARKVCYFFVRPKVRYLELCIFLPRAVKSPRIRKVYESSTVKRAHMLRVVHRDEVEAPLTDWLREAYDFADPQRPSAAASRMTSTSPASPSAKRRSKPAAARTVKPAPRSRNRRSKAAGNAKA